MDDLAVLVPAPRIVEAGARRIEITPIKVLELASFARAIEPIGSALAAGDVLHALATNADHVIDAVAIGARVNREWLGDQDVDVLIDLVVAVLEVNSDFFVARVLPALNRAATALQVAGSTSRPPSSATATPTPM